MKKIITALAAVVIVALQTAPVEAKDKPEKPEEAKVTICHRTNADTNPYVQITVDVSAVDGLKGADHYGEHQGPIWNDTLKAQHIEWGDIIPPVDAFHAGLNWNAEGQAIFNAGCNLSTPPTTEPPTPPTTEPPVVEPPVVEPPVVKPPVGLPPVVAPPVVAPPVTPPVVNPPVALPPTVNPDAEVVTRLPHTGSETTYLAILGTILIIGGMALTRKANALA